MRLQHALALASLLFAGWTQADPIPTEPAPGLTPAAVVAAQLSALKEDSEQGLARVFAFASLDNQAQTGPVAHFAAMIREGYPELLGHASAELGPLELKEDTAAQAVDITARDGKRFHYLFILSRQPSGDCEGCWRTDSVLNSPAEDGTAI
jgi:hypothetical protein